VKEVVGHIVILLGAAVAASVLYASIAPDRPQDQPAPDPSVTAVVTLPQRASTAAIAPPVSPHEGHGSLARQIQSELRRVGCYDGEVNGLWTTSTRFAMQVFTERVNARLPLDKPDPAHLALIQGQQGRVCGSPPCGTGDARHSDARCQAATNLARAPYGPESSGIAPQRTPAPPLADAPAIAAIAPKLVSPPTEATRPKDPPKSEAAPRLISLPSEAVRPKDQGKPDATPAAPKADAPPPPTPVRVREAPVASDPADPPPQRSAREPGPTPPVGIYEGRPKRTWRSVQSRQIAYARSVVRNLKRAVKTALPLP
jgi:hypothetical protein